MHEKQTGIAPPQGIDRPSFASWIEDDRLRRDTFEAYIEAAKLAEVSANKHSLELTIPTSNGIVSYKRYEGGTGCTANRTLKDYLDFLYLSQKDWDFLTKDKNVLDTGSGAALPLIETTLKSPQSKLFGIDLGYSEKASRDKIDLARPGVQLMHGNWDDFSMFPDNYMDTFFSVFSVFYWGSEGEWERAEAEMTRVAKPGAFFLSRFVNPKIVQGLESMGWVVKAGQANTVVAEKQR
jgi:hypothetical protein